MGKALKIFLIIILSIVAISLTSVMILVMTGSVKFGDFHFNFGSKVSEKLSYSNTYEKAFNNINIDVDSADIEIKEAEDNKFSLVVYDDYDKLELKDETETLDIKLPSKKCHFFCFNQVMGKVILSVPSDYANRIKISSNYGDVSIGNFKEAKLDITTDYGDIDIAGVYNVTINEDYGNIKIDNLYNYVYIEDDYGDINIKNAVINKNSKIDTDYGDVKISNINNVYIDAKTDYGDVKISNSSANYKIKLKIRTDYGDIKVGTNNNKTKLDKNAKYVVNINEQEYNISFENNATAESLINLFPISFDMNELNGNEKYTTLKQGLVSNPKKINHIEAGDICLYEDNNLVIFYKTFDTIYEYTKIGHIDNLPDLGTENITVKFEKK